MIFHVILNTEQIRTLAETVEIELQELGAACAAASMACDGKAVRLIVARRGVPRRCRGEAERDGQLGRPGRHEHALVLLARTWNPTQERTRRTMSKIKIEPINHGVHTIKEVDALAVAALDGFVRAVAVVELLDTTSLAWVEAQLMKQLAEMKDPKTSPEVIYRAFEAYRKVVTASLTGGVS